MSLDIRTEPGGERLYVEGLPIHAGDGLELRLADGTWIAGRYEYVIGDGKLRRLLLYTGHGPLALSRSDELRLPRGGR